MRRLSRGLMLVAMAIAVACEGGPSGPQPGSLSVTLQDPNSGDGAILLTVTGPAVPMSVTAAAGDTLWGGPFTQLSSQMIVTGNIKSGVILTLGVTDVTEASKYSVAATQVAASADYSLRALTGYTLTVSK